MVNTRSGISTEESNVNQRLLNTGGGISTEEPNNFNQGLQNNCTNVEELTGNFNTSARSANPVCFRDVQESLSTFSGDDTYSVLKWIADIEEMAEILGWDDLSLFVYGKKLLTGRAQLFIRSENGIRSWSI